MIFRHSQKQLSKDDVLQVEAEIHLNLPKPVKDFYLSANGGNPDPYVFTNGSIDTVVSEFLPLKSANSGTAVDSYKRLVMELKLLPKKLFPFAVDGGGDYFFVDCFTDDGKVYFFRSDSTKGDRLVMLDLSFSEFWKSLTAE